MKNNLFLILVSSMIFNGCINAQESKSLFAEMRSEQIKVGKFVVMNPMQSFRECETVSLDWKDVMKMVPDITKGDIAVFDFKMNRLLVTQVVDEDTKTELLFQTNLAPNEKKYFRVMKQPVGLEKPKSRLMTYCRFVPEREDDFAWENDLIAFRMYGPALWENIVNSGVDCWLKRVPYSIIDKWYGQMKKKSYHTDWGEGHDPYHVGKTTGCGGLRIVEGGKFLHSNVYDKWKVIANGPIRSIFELTYDNSWKAFGKNLVETKRISIDLGQRLCRLESRFNGPDTPGIQQFAIGLTTHDGKAQSDHNPSGDMAYCWEKIEEHYLGTAAIVISPDVQEPMTITSKNKDESHIYLLVNKTDQPVITYYAGYSWEKAGAITTLDAWRAYLEDYVEKLKNPVTVHYHR